MYACSPSHLGGDLRLCLEKEPKEAAGVWPARLSWLYFSNLSDWPGARSGLGDIVSVGHGVRIQVTYSYEVRTVIPIMLLNSEVTPTRGKGF